MKIFISVLLIIILALSLNIELDNSALALHDEIFQRAMIAFGLAKGLNAVISLIQGTELSFAVGIGLNLSVGEVLDPFNDMVERFSWVMLLSSVSLGIIKIILVLSSKIFLQISIAVTIAVISFLIWAKKFQNIDLITLFVKILALFLLLRFSAIIFIYSSELLYNTTLKNEYINSSKIIEQTKGKLENLQSSNENIISKKELSFMDRFNSKSNEIINSFKLSNKLKSLEENIELASLKIINIITIFILQAILMPLLFLWFFISIIKFIFHLKLDKEKIILLLNKKRV